MNFLVSSDQGFTLKEQGHQGNTSLPDVSSVTHVASSGLQVVMIKELLHSLAEKPARPTLIENNFPVEIWTRKAHVCVCIHTYICVYVHIYLLPNHYKYYKLTFCPNKGT